MDTAKIWTVLCAFLLLICLTLSITSVVVLRNALAENDAWQTRAQALTEDLVACLSRLEEDPDSIPVDTPLDDGGSGDADMDADILYNRFCLRETGGKIGIYNDEGYLVRLLDTDVQTLPPSEREALQNGFCVNSWEELLEWIQNYE